MDHLYMTNNTSSALLSMNLTTENPSAVEHEQTTREDYEVNSPLSYIEQQKPSSSSSQSLSLGDHRRLALSDFHDPLYYQPALQLHCNLSHPPTLASGYRNRRSSSINERREDWSRPQTEIQFIAHSCSKKYITEWTGAIL